MGPVLQRFAREITSARAEMAGGVPSSPQAGKKPAERILVVDDERLIRWCLRDGLRRDGFDVEEASDAEAAERLLTSGADRFAGVILDYDQRFCDPPDLTVLRHIRTLAPRVPVLVLTACPEPTMRTGAIACGAAGVIDKPFDVSNVVAMMHAAIDRAS